MNTERVCVRCNRPGVPGAILVTNVRKFRVYRLCDRCAPDPYYRADLFRLFGYQWLCGQE